jgi:hypothetical protein
MPYICAPTAITVPMQISKSRVVAIAIERFLRGPLDQDQNLAGLDIAAQALAEPAEGDDSAAVLAITKSDHF